MYALCILLYAGIFNFDVMCCDSFSISCHEWPFPKIVRGLQPWGSLCSMHSMLTSDGIVMGAYLHRNPSDPAMLWALQASEQIRFARVEIRTYP